MKIIDGIKKVGGRVTIPDCSRDDLPAFFVEMGYKKGAEIGSYKGEFTEKFAKAGLEIYAIDPWIPYQHRELDDMARVKRHNDLYEHTKRVLAPYPNAHLIRKTSMDALVDFPDDSLDFVYIDGNHNFRYVAEDLVEWTKKVKKGGCVSGHDYAYFGSRWDVHVRWVVDAYMGCFMRNWYVLGSVVRREGEKRDRYRSWMFIR